MTTKDLIRAGIKFRGQLPSRSVMRGEATDNTQAVALDGADEGLNKTERAYRDLLEFRKRAGEIRDYRTHAMTFILGKDCRYTPEFSVMENDRSITMIEVKGFMRDDALVKFRAAQNKFPWFKWIMVQRSKGEWETIRE